MCLFFFLFFPWTNFDKSQGNPSEIRFLFLFDFSGSFLGFFFLLHYILSFSRNFLPSPITFIFFSAFTFEQNKIIQSLNANELHLIDQPKDEQKEKKKHVRFLIILPTLFLHITFFSFLLSPRQRFYFCYLFSLPSLQYMFTLSSRQPNDTSKCPPSRRNGDGSNFTYFLGLYTHLKLKFQEIFMLLFKSLDEV